MENYLPVYGKTISERQEKNVNVEFTLPEYLPNISKIVKVSVLPSVKISENTENAVKATGKAVFAVVYLSDFNNNLKSTVISEDFSTEFSRHNDESYMLANPILDCSVYAAEEKAIATSPRKINASCKLILRAEETAMRKNEVFDEKENEKIKKLVKKVDAMSKKDFGEVPFHIEEKLSLEGDMPGIREIVFADCSIAKDSCVMENDEAKISGNIIFNCLYHSATDAEQDMPEYISMSKEIPFNVNIPALEAWQETNLSSKVCITGISADAMQDSYGDSNMIGLFVDGVVHIKGYANEEFLVCEDLFSTEFPVSCKASKVEYDSFDSIIRDTINISEDVHTGLGSIVRIISQEARVIPVSEEILEDSILLNARVYLKLVGTDELGSIECTNTSFMIKVPLVGKRIANPDKCEFETDISVRKCSCEIVNGEIKCDLTLCVELAVSTRNSINAVVAIETDDENKYVRNNSEYIIYYPSNEDTVWSVAKKYKVSPEELSVLNEIKSEISEKKTVIIPR